MQEKLQILRTKLHPPPIRSDLVYRTDLIEKLNYNYQKNALTLVCAPAGYGKSSLISSWLTENNILSTWILLDENDNDLRIFLEYVVTAVKRICPGCLKKTSEILQAVELPPLSLILNMLLNELDVIEKEFVLVLDDYHNIRDEKIHKLIDELLRYPAENMLLCIATRRDPPLKIGSLRAHNRLNELRMNDLSFNLNEASILYKNMFEFEIGESILKKILIKTEGWVTGLILTAHSVSKLEQLKSKLKMIDGNFRLVAEYFVEEVLLEQPEHIQTYLLKTSLLNKFCAELTEKLFLSKTGKDEKRIGGEEFIEWIKKANLFVIPLDEEHKWFRYHHEFQNLLQMQLNKRRTEQQIKDILLSASKWFDKNGFIEEAIIHAMKAGDTSFATHIILDNWSGYSNKDQWYVIERWMTFLPEEDILNSASLLLIRTWIALAKYKISEIPLLLNQVKLTGSDLTDAESGSLSYFKALLCYSSGKGEEALKLAEKALMLIPQKYYRIRGYVTSWRMFSMIMIGQGNRAIQSLKEAFNNSNPQREPDLYALLLVQQNFMHLFNANLPEIMAVTKIFSNIKDPSDLTLGWIGYFQVTISWWGNDLEAAVREIDEIIKYRFHSNRQVVIDAYIAQALALQALNKPTEATKVMNQLIEFAEWTLTPQNLSIAHSAQARLALLQGDLPAAEKWLNSVENPGLNPVIFWWIEIPAITFCKVLIAKASSASLQKALELLDEYRVYVESINNKVRTIEIVLLQVQVNYKLECESKALDALKYGLELASKGEWIRPFLDVGSDIADLLLQLQKQDIEVEFIERILSAFKEEEDRKLTLTTKTQNVNLFSEKSKSEVESLTNREIEVLDLIAKGLRNREIAEKIFLAPTTIKKHIYNIYQKLDVHSRLEVVTKARELNFISK